MFGDLQQFFTQLVSNLANSLPLGYAFGAGMVSAVNPCGFAMLPAFLGLYLGAREALVVASGEGGLAEAEFPLLAIPIAIGKATLVAGVVTAGFVLLFAAVGSLISAGGQFIISAIPWIALSIGFALALLGLWLLTGRHIYAGFAAQLAGRLGDPGRVGLRGFLAFGVAYATASLSCTLPIFLTVVGGSLAVRGFGNAVLQFISYGLGMGLIILILAVGVGVFKGGLVGGVRKAVPFVERVSPILMVLAGSYIIYYWLIKGRLIDTFL